MATKRRSYVRVPCAVHRAALTNHQLAALVRLQAVMAERWAVDGLTAAEATTVHLVKTDLCRVMGYRGRPDLALKSARLLANIATISVELRGEVTVIRWPKLADSQGWKDRERPQTGASSPTPTPTPTPTREDPPSEGALAPLAPATDPTRWAQLFGGTPEAVEWIRTRLGVFEAIADQKYDRGVDRRQWNAVVREHLHRWWLRRDEFERRLADKGFRTIGELSQDRLDAIVGDLMSDPGGKTLQ